MTCEQHKSLQCSKCIVDTVTDSKNISDKQRGMLAGCPVEKPARKLHPPMHTKEDVRADMAALAGAVMMQVNNMHALSHETTTSANAAAYSSRV
jgi:hypothetical protein